MLGGPDLEGARKIETRNASWLPCVSMVSGAPQPFSRKHSMLPPSRPASATRFQTDLLADSLRTNLLEWNDVICLSSSGLLSIVTSWGSDFPKARSLARRKDFWNQLPSGFELGRHGDDVLYGLGIAPVLFQRVGALPAFFDWQSVINSIIGSAGPTHPSYYPPSYPSSSSSKPSSSASAAASCDQSDAGSTWGEAPNLNAQIVPAASPSLVSAQSPGIARKVGSMSRDQLVKLVLKQDRAVVELRRELRTKNQALRRRTSRLRVHKNTVKTHKEAVKKGTSALFKRGKADRYMTLGGGLSLALRRATGNTSASSLTWTLQMDVSGKTVIRYEVLLRASLVAASLSFHQQHQRDLRFFANDPNHGGAWCFEVHVLRGDATNAAIWQRQKIRCSEMES
eukprot:8620859-Pyramimonas_sp.AAC.1